MLLFFTELLNIYSVVHVFLCYLDNSIGDVCQNDLDGDGVPNDKDVCPEDPAVSRTDFSDYMTVDLDTGTRNKVKPEWRTFNNVRIL